MLQLIAHQLTLNTRRALGVGECAVRDVRVAAAFVAEARPANVRIRKGKVARFEAKQLMTAQKMLDKLSAEAAQYPEIPV
jgi:D-aminopeptidase